MPTKLEFSRGDLIADAYEVVDVLDDSPLGTTYRCKHVDPAGASRAAGSPTSGGASYVRLQVLRPRGSTPEHLARVAVCFEKSKATEHPHLVKMLEQGQFDGIAYYTYEDIEGGTLRDLLTEYQINGKQFALKEAAQICIQILEGLGELHKHGIIVRALRPEYVLINVRYTGPRKQTFLATTKITGLGLWDLVDTAELAEDEFTRREAQYIATELLGFQPTPTPKSDVYSVAVIFYEMLIGQAPVGTFQNPRIRRPDLPEHVGTVVELALANAPEDRYPSTGDFIRDLSRTFVDVPFEVGPRRLSFVLVFAWFLAMLVVAFVAIIVFNRRDPDIAAEAEDATLRKVVFEEIQAKSPTPEEYKRVYAQHPKNMVYIPEGPFVAGRLHNDPLAGSNEPLAERRETKAYLIDVFEYPNLLGQAPRAVTWVDADRLCKAASKRLCTADEWERACKGPNSTIYSYGDTFDQEFCGKGIEELHMSGALPNCKSGWGVFDMSGSFREWTGTSVTKDRRLVKGGEKRSSDKATRCANGSDELVSYGDRSLSFRCCRDLDAPPAAPEDPSAPPP